jgi:hypothetical protein
MFIMKIKSVALTALQNEEWFQLLSQFRQIVREKGAETLKIKELFEIFSPIWQTAYDILEGIRTSGLTNPIAELDAKRDELFTGLKKQVEGLASHYDAAKRTAANNLLRIFNQYGRIDRENYNKETGSMTNLIQEFNTTFAADTALLGLQAWVTELDKANKEFNNLYMERGKEDGDKMLLAKMVDVRREGNEIYNRIIERIEALQIVEGEANYKEFIVQLNGIIEKYRNLLAQREGRREKNKEEENKNK